MFKTRTNREPLNIFLTTKSTPSLPPTKFCPTPPRVASNSLKTSSHTNNDLFRRHMTHWPLTQLPISAWPILFTTLTKNNLENASFKCNQPTYRLSQNITLCPSFNLLVTTLLEYVNIFITDSNTHHETTHK